MRLLSLLSVFVVLPGFAQDAPALGASAVSAVVTQYTINPFSFMPGTHTSLPLSGKWSIRTARPESCPHDDTPCARVVYTVAEAHVACEWTVVPQQGSTPAAFLDQNEDASRYLLRKLNAGEVAPLVATSPQPIYPPIARAAHVEGPVVIRLVVLADGSVVSATAVSGPPMLRSAASDAAEHWTFHALRVGSQPAAFTGDVNADFRLVKNRSDGTLPQGAVSMHP